MPLYVEAYVVCMESSEPSLRHEIMLLVHEELAVQYRAHQILCSRYPCVNVLSKVHIGATKAKIVQRECFQLFVRNDL